jgi:glucose-6-phosphate dehydrogenase assembly protein OpcA
MDVAATASWQGTDVDAGTVQGQIGSVWKDVTQQGSYKTAIRTSILNLVVFAHDREEAHRLSDELRNCSQRHPSRTIILVADRLHAGTSIDAEVMVYCTSGGSVPLCYEEIIVTGHGRAADHLASAATPLLLPELPTYLWWPGQPPFGHRMFHRLLSIADQLVVDSGQFSLPGDGFANLAHLVQGRQGVNDFNWGRLTAWREVVAQFFDGPTWSPYAYDVRSVELEFGTGADDFRRATAGLLLLLAWVSTGLGWEPETTLEGLASQAQTLSVLQGERLIEIHLRFRDHGPRLAGRLCGIELVSQPRTLPPARFSVQRREHEDHAHVLMSIHEGPEIQRVVPLQIKSDAELLTDELELAGHDRQYEVVVEMASRLAGREIWIPA